MKLNVSLAQPLYRQLMQNLGEEIRNLSDGSKLPSEQEIGERYGVSRITVRAALKELTASGQLVTLQGKGTYVNKKKMTRNLSLATSFSQACIEMGRRPGAKVLHAAIETADEDDIKELQLLYGEEVVVLHRLRYADDVPISYEIDRSPKSYAFLLNEDLNDASLLHILNTKYQIEFDRIRRTIELVYASPPMAKLLNIRVNHPLLYVAGTGNDTVTGRPGQRSHQYIIGDKFKYIV